MALDQSAFLLMTGALAAGGVGGYYAHQQGWIGNDHATQAVSVPEPMVAERTDAGALSAAQAAAVQPVMTAAPLPLCDDSQGTAGECPAPGMPTDEGGCGTFIITRCQDFKASLKPRVAEAAVSCLRDLKPTERCDKNRVNLCGHLALTNACMEPVSTPAAASSGTVTTAAANTPPAAGSVAALCESIVKAAGTSRTGPTLADCKQTLSGMNDTGRLRMAACMQKNWSTKGLLGCEAIDPTKPT